MRAFVLAAVSERSRRSSISQDRLPDDLGIWSWRKCIETVHHVHQHQEHMANSFDAFSGNGVTSQQYFLEWPFESVHTSGMRCSLDVYRIARLDMTHASDAHDASWPPRPRLRVLKVLVAPVAKRVKSATLTTPPR